MPSRSFVSHLVARRRAVCQGSVESVTLRPKDVSAQVNVVLNDGTGQLRLVWLGRRSIGGIVVGADVIVEGMIALEAGRLTMFNPKYELLPTD